MNKFLMICVACLFAVNVSAQSLQDVIELINKQKWKDGKTAVDKFLADSKNVGNSDAWYFKGRIYNALSYDKTITPVEGYDLRLKAFDAFKKTQELDTKDVRLKVESYRPYLDLYYGLFDLGAAQFNDKQYMDAYNSFQRAQEVKDFILQRKYEYKDVHLYALDTALVLNSGIAASLAKNDELAIPQYRKLVDANVTGTTYKEIYEALVEYYYKKEDLQNLNPLLVKSKSIYPEDNYWTDIEMDMVRKTGDKTALMNKYKEMIEKNPTNYGVAYNYSVELFNSLYGKDAITKDVDATKELLTTTLKNTIPNDKGIDATVLLANHFYNMASDISADITRLKGTSPEAIKKKSDLNKLYNKKMDEFIEYGEKASVWYDAQPSLKPVQKGTYKGLLNNLSEVYTVKKDVKKASATAAKKNALN
ncbi:MAG: hypothetical protein ABIY51_03230 [Ferruginibacter sp.]